MIRKLLVTTAMATLLASGAYAQTTTEPAPVAPAPTETQPAAPAVTPSDGHLASNLIGETVYSGTGENAQNIGQVNDIVIDSAGQVQAVVVGIGGFLGIGEKNVALEYATLDWAEENGDRWLVVAASKEQLEALPTFDTAPYEPAPAVALTEPANPPAATAPADDTAMAPAPEAAPPADESTAAAPPAASDNTTAAAPAATDDTQTAAIDRASLTEIPADQISAENLLGTTVYGADDSNVGEIGDVVMSTDGKIDAVVIDVGGFLGVGEKPVAVGFDNLAFMQDADGNRYLYTQFTKEQLDAQPTYDESTWAEKRDEQRLMIQ